jgi:hypothetical protein
MSLDALSAPARDPFVDAVVGLASVCRRLGEAGARGELIALVPADRPEMIEAVLGALSLKKTIELVIAGLVNEVLETERTSVDPAAPDPQEVARWERDLLR